MWPWVGAALLLLLLGFMAVVWWRVPLLINPWAAFADFQDGAIEPATLHLMALMLPVVALLLLVVMLLLLVFITVALRNERRLLELLEREKRED